MQCNALYFILCPSYKVLNNVILAEIRQGLSLLTHPLIFKLKSEQIDGTILFFLLRMRVYSNMKMVYRSMKD